MHDDHVMHAESFVWPLSHTHAYTLLRRVVYIYAYTRQLTLVAYQYDGNNIVNHQKQ